MGYEGGGNRKGQGAAKDSAAPLLTLQHLQGVFYVLGLAWVAGSGVLLLELLIHRHRHKINERPHRFQH